jgi:hypothetical protein
MLKNIIGSKREKETGVWRKLHNKELQNLYFAPNLITSKKKKKKRGVR